MTPTLLDALPLWMILGTSFAIILFAAEVGHRLGLLRHPHDRREKEATAGSMVATQLGLLAFLLAFTFGLAASRFETRRQAVLDEANVISTAFLRSKMLQEPQRAEVQKLLREYVDVRLAGVEENKLESSTRRSTEIHKELWSATVAASEKDARPVQTSLIIPALNDLINVHTKRIFAAIGSRIPTIVWLVLYGVAILSFGSMGYHSGLTGAGRSPVALSLAGVFAAVMCMVVDLDRPQEGFLHVSQKPLVEVRSMIK